MSVAAKGFKESHLTDVKIEDDAVKAIVGSSTIEIKNVKLPAVPKRMSVCAMNDVLATNIENSK